MRPSLEIFLKTIKMILSRSSERRWMTVIWNQGHLQSVRLVQLQWIFYYPLHLFCLGSERGQWGHSNMTVFLKQAPQMVKDAQLAPPISKHMTSSDPLQRENLKHKGTGSYSAGRNGECLSLKVVFRYRRGRIQYREEGTLSTARTLVSKVRAITKDVCVRACGERKEQRSGSSSTLETSM